MATAIIIFALTTIAMILSVLFFPKLHIKHIEIDTYWLITTVGAITMLLFGRTDFSSVLKGLTSHTAINPIKILLLFISMTILSIFLDELGFFRYLASATLKRAKSGQVKLFLYLYLTVSVLTVFTSNDIIVLSFTPFICYFAKNAKINAIPYLAAEFIAANTWSMALIIGNPTNIYLATSCAVDFAKYLEINLFPTVMAGITAFIALYFTYRKQLKMPVSGESESVVISDKPLLIIGIIHLAVCTLLLAVSSYIHIEMWLVSVCAVISLTLFNLVISAIRRTRPTPLIKCFKRAPYQLVPFIISMFVMIISLQEQGVTQRFGKLLSGDLPVAKYGVCSFLFANLINNIPMSVLFSSILGVSNAPMSAVFATVIGSNLGALLTPIGSLAGIMWTSILNKYGEKFTYADFLKMGATCALPTVISALVALQVVFMII